MFRVRNLIPLILLACLVGSSSAAADLPADACVRARLNRSDAPGARMAALKVAVTEDPPLIVTGSFPIAHDDTLVAVWRDAGGKLVRRLLRSNFRFEISVPTEERVIEFLSVSVRGTVASEQVKVLAEPRYDCDLGVDWVFTPTLGLSSRNYSQRNLTPISVRSGQVELELTRLSPRRAWRVGVGGIATAVANVSGAQNSVRLFEARGFLGRVVRLPYLHPVQIGLDAGYRYSTLLVSQAAFGYAALVGPELRLTGATRVSERNTVELAIRWSLALSATGLASPANREWAIAATWNYLDWGLRASWSNLGITAEEISSKAWGIGVQYRLH